MNKTALLIPVYNNSSGLLKSVASIDIHELIDVIIVDDGSKLDLIDENQLINAFCATGKINFIYLESNKGIEYALNIGLHYVLENGYQFTARLDAGDLCLGQRFKIQEEYLLKNNDIKLIGSNAIARNLAGEEVFKYYFPTKYQEILKKIYLNAVFVHPTIIFKNEILQDIGLYPTKYKAAEDYAFTLKIAKKYQVENLDLCLVQVELNPNGISLTKRKTQIKGRILILLDNFYFGFYPIYGLLRNFILYVAPDKFIYVLKSYFVHKK